MICGLAQELSLVFYSQLCGFFIFFLKSNGFSLPCEMHLQPSIGTLDIVVLEGDPMHNITQHLVLVQWAFSI